MASELRTDVLTGAQVIIAPGRSTRPDTFRVDAPPLPPAVPACPFCDGNELDTPPEVMRCGIGAPDTPGWRVRVVPNKYPIVGAGGVSGAHEVVVLSPAHDRSFADLDEGAAVEALTVVRDRVGALLAVGHRHAHAFINHGKPAGASIEHPHAQVIALDFVPPFVEHMLERFTAIGRDVVHDAIDEARDANLLLAPPVGEDAVVTWCPPASSGAYATRLAFPFGRRRFDVTTDAEIAVLAHALRDVLRRLRIALGDAPYNVMVNTAPADDGRPYHWWVDVVPRLTVSAGFEAATGLDVCTVAPEDAVAALRSP
jgi:UDPglucose--hexose-1-phosphate uridylyltransferase